MGPLPLSQRLYPCGWGCGAAPTAGGSFPLEVTHCQATLPSSAVFPLDPPLWASPAQLLPTPAGNWPSALPLREGRSRSCGCPLGRPLLLQQPQPSSPPLPAGMGRTGYHRLCLVGPSPSWSCTPSRGSTLWPWHLRALGQWPRVEPGHYSWRL